MSNPWEEISLDDYESHMSLDSVKQLQALDLIMKDQFDAYHVETAMILGVAGGNGLEHIDIRKYKRVYGVDINEEYLRAVSERYESISHIFRYLRLDLTKETDKLPNAQLLIANLLIEYIGYSAFVKAVMQVGAEYVSSVIQVNTDKKSWVSDSPYLHAFDGLDEVHHQIDQKELTAVMEKAGYSVIFQSLAALPNGKALLRMDFCQKQII